MSAKPKIKVIKKGAVISPKPSTVAVKKEKQARTREMVATVTDWVNDFQTRKSEEARNAFKNLFGTQPNEA